jgi:tRNA(Met) C34 N-acetyltransferase TmcA
VTARQQFRRDLPWALADVLTDLPPELAIRLLHGRECTDLVLSGADALALARIAAGARQAETAAAVLWRWLVVVAASGCADPAVAALFAWRVQRWPIERVCRVYCLDGVSALHDHLRTQLAASTMPPTVQLT